MNCDESKDLMIVSLYGRLTPDERARLQEHINQCPRCEGIYSKTAEYPSLTEDLEEIPSPDWDKSWRIISARALGRKKRPLLFGVPRRYAYAGTAFLCVFILGLVVGSRLFSPRPRAEHLARSILPGPESPTRSYAENLEALLSILENRSGAPASDELSQAEKTLLRDMLIQTRLLKSTVSRSDDPLLRGLLEDLEVILVAVSNLRSGDRLTRDLLHQQIRDKRLELQLQVLSDRRTYL